MTHTIFICRTCCASDEQPEGEEFARRLQDEMEGKTEFEDVVVQPSRCMLTCGEPLALSLNCSGKMSYLFADVRPEHDLRNVLTLVELYTANPTGAIVDARPIGRLRHCLKGRLPAT